MGLDDFMGLDDAATGAAMDISLPSSPKPSPDAWVQGKPRVSEGTKRHQPIRFLSEMGALEEKIVALGKH